MKRTKKSQLKQNKGITLIALVITIIVLLILAGVTIAALSGPNGILTQAQEAKRKTEEVSQNEQSALDRINDYISENTEGAYSKEKKVNTPKLVLGMTKVMFQLPEENNEGKIIESVESEFNENNWYNYEESKWANAMTKDGSMWVWIPRYAYKINSIDKSVDVKFLIGTTDQYYDDEGNIQTAKRATSADEEVDTTTDYYVHPSFTNESSINYANGGWDSELTGIWVAKFEAGYASGNNNSEVKASTVNYTQEDAWVKKVEAGTESDSSQYARNWLDGIYGSTTTSIKYPTFQGLTYSMNYINLNDAYNISRALTEEGNIYGFNSITTDSHLMKNSEWGAVVYLGQSEYGLNKEEVYINNVSLNSGNRQRTESTGKSGVDSVYAVTGVTTGTTNAREKQTTIENINGITGNTASDGVYTWKQIEGQKASSTGNMYGIFDLSGGTWERTAGYVANGNGKLKTYGASLAYDGSSMNTTSTKYVMVYPDNEGSSGDIDTESKNNYAVNTKIFGDAIRETSTAGIGSKSWNVDCSYFPALNNPFSVRGGYLWKTSDAGLFAFDRTDGNSLCSYGFRSVLVCL